MAGEKYICGIDKGDCTIETIGICIKLCDFDKRIYVNNNPGSCDERKSVASQRKYRSHSA